MTANSKIVNITATFRNTEATEALRKYAEEKLGNVLRKFVHHDTEARIELLVEKKRQIVEITFNLEGVNIKNTEESDDMYKTIDQLVDSLTNQLRKHKEKKTSHH